jgi:hypothetical protein
MKINNRSNLNKTAPTIILHEAAAAFVISIKTVHAAIAVQAQHSLSNSSLRAILKT